jgi:hypothetical protein
MQTNTKLRNLKPTDKLYKVNDRDGRYVAVTPAGSISFRDNDAIHGTQEAITFGRYESHQVLDHLLPNGLFWFCRCRLSRIFCPRRINQRIIKCVARFCNPRARRRCSGQPVF